MKILQRLFCAVLSALAMGAGPMAMAVEPPVRIMPLGDSLTSGVSGSTIVGAYRNRLHTVLTNAGYNVDFVGTFQDGPNPGLPDIDHQGQGSARIDQIQANLAGWLNSIEDPDVVLLLIGTNDFWQNYQLSTVQTRLSNLIADIATRRPLAKIIVSTLPVRTDNPTINSQQVAFNSAIPGIVAQQVALGRQVSMVDMYAALSPSDINGDGVHPNQTGSNKMGDAWFPAIASVISPQGTANPPVIARIGAVTSTQVPVVFSKPVSDASASVSNFSIPGITITGASLDSATKRTITLTTSPLTQGVVHNLSVTGVRDRTILQTPIAPGSMASFSLGALVNGGFEDNLTGWTTSGNMQVKSASPYVTTEGSRTLAFNSDQSVPNGILSQAFATTPGQSYQLSFDVGALGYNTNEQRCQVSVIGSSLLVSDTIAVRAPSNGGTRWLARSYTFTANSATTSLTFTDVSTNTTNIDLVLDNVKVGVRTTRSLAITSNPIAGAAMTVSPSDVAGAAGGATGLIRQYDDGATVTVTAPPTLGPDSFVRWQRNGIDLPGSLPAITVTMGANVTLNAVYGSNNAPVAAADAYATPSGSALIVPAGGVLTNDADADGGTLAAVISAPPLNGTLVLNTNGGFTYTPATGFTGTDSFTYTANDGVSSSNIATVSVTVYPDLGQLIVNGSFEADFTGWTRSGNMLIQSASPYVTTNGSKLLAFNAAQATPNGIITQSFPTIAGQTYQLAFDMGVFAYNTNAQRLEVKLDGSSNLFNQTLTVNGIGSGNTRWVPQTIPFTANSSTTTLTFRDVSTTSNSIDLVLDNVRVTGTVPNHNLTVESTPSTAVPVAVSPPDRNSAAAGSTNFSRSYAQGTIVNLSAPATAAGSAFQKWQKNGVDHSTNRNTSVSIDSATTMTAVFGVNSAPVAVADSYSTLVNTPLNTPPPGVLANDTDADLNTLTAALVAPPANGTLVLNPNGGFTYTPNTGYTGPDSFSYRANDGSTDSETVTVSLNVAGITPGTLSNGSFELGESGWTMTGNRLVVDSAPPYTSTHGTKLLVFNGAQTQPTGVISQTFNTVVGQAYQLELDMGVVGGTSTSQSMQVTLVGSAPLLSRLETLAGTGTSAPNWSAKSYTFIADSTTTTLTIEDKSTNGNAVDLLLDNVRLATGNARILSVASSLGNGVPVSVAPNDIAGRGNGNTEFSRFYGEGAVVNLTAPSTQSGNAFLKWQKDGVDYATTPATNVTIGAANLTMTAVYRMNSAPVAVADSFTGEMESLLTVAAPGVLDNDSDIDATPLTATLVADAANGTVTLNADGSFIYQPNPGFSGSDSFTYKANDGSLDSDIVTVSLTVNPFAQGTLVNGSFEEGETGWTITGNRIVADSSAPYIPRDGTKLMVANGGNVTPDAVISQTIATTPGKTYVINLDMGVVASGSTAVGAVQSLRVIAAGTAELLNRVESVTSTSATVATWAPKSFTFVADSATTTISLRDVSSSGIFRDLLIDNVRCEIRIDRTLNVSASPEAGLAVTVSPNDLTGAGNGTTAFTRTYQNGAAVTLTAPATSGGSDFLKWTRNGIDFASTPATTVTMTGNFTMTAVYGSNTAPLAVADSYSTNAGETLTVNAPGVLGNDSDVDGNPMTAVLVTGPANGTLNLDPNGSFTYQPAPGFTGSDSFTYRASDGSLTSNLVTVSLGVQAAAAGNLVNGSFEQGETGWTITGNRLVANSSAPYVATDESKLMVLNAGQVSVNATLSQSFATTPGQEYALEFDVGAIGTNGTQQRLGLTVVGTSTLLSQIETVTATGTSAAVWASKRFLFTANSPSTTLNFADLSTTGTSVDLLLDNVRVNPAGTRTLIVGSTGNGMTVAVSPADRAGTTDGTNRFHRFYANGTVVTLTAPPSYGGGNFLKWTRNGADHATGATTTVIMDGDITMAAVYSPPPQLLVNGSFEEDYTGWTKTGNQEIKSGSPYTATNGLKIAGFNTAQLLPNGELTQTFPTISGQTYELEFDLGVLAYNTNSQRMQVTVTGSSALISQTISIQGISGGMRWIPQAFSFTANSNTTTLAFRDVSTTTNSIDLLLDNVRVIGAAAQRTITVASSPATGAAITVSPADIGGNSDGVTQFTRAYDHGATVTLTAPANHGGLPFSKWTRNGSNFGSTPALTLTVDGDHTYTAVYASNNAPVANADAFDILTGNTLTITAPGVLANDTDADADLLTAALVAAPASGTVTLNADGSFTYIPATSFTGTDSFTYKANDGKTDSGTATVTINVQAAPPRTLTVNSVGATGVPISASPADTTGASDGLTSFTRSYQQGTSVTLTAPASHGLSIFSKWQRNGVDFAITPSTILTVDADVTMTAIYQAPVGTNLVTNGSFESDFTSWALSGNMEIQSGSPYAATDGNKQVAFNSSGNAPNGILSQSFATTPGASYTLTFDAGVLSYNTSPQTMQVSVNGNGALVNRNITITRSSGANILWQPQIVAFVANSSTTTIAFADKSTVTNGLDLLLDNVRVTENLGVVPLPVLTVQSTPVQAEIAVSANDVNGNGNGSTTFGRVYAAGTAVTLTAPGTSSGVSFIKWQRNGVDAGTNPVLNVTMSESQTVTAVYSHPPFSNGSFETGTFAPWTTSGGTTDNVRIKSDLPATDGTRIVEFNGSNSPSGGILTQTFLTSPGVNYSLQFDLGVVAFNTNQQSVRVNVAGTSSLLNQTTAIAGNGAGTAKWETKSYNFTANSTTTTLTFTDISTVTSSIDMLLDNVRVSNASARSLTVNAVAPGAVAMTVSPIDNLGLGDGTTLLSRSYNSGTAVTVTAPATTNGATFVKWVRDGADFSTNPVASFTISADTSLIAVYSGGNFPALGSNLIRNHSFELSPDYAFWSQSGSTRIEKPQASSGFPTDGNHILSFNVGGTGNDGKVSQAFATTIGTTYTVQMDVGVYGGPGGAAIDQTLNIRTVGVGIPLNRNVTVRGSSTEFVWAPQSFTFVADSTTTTLHLADVSTSGAGTDLFVDNVRVRSGTLPPVVMTVNSTPDPGKAITVGTTDLAGQANGSTNFTRIHNSGTSVAMVAPHQNFVKWLKNGQWYATNPSINAVLDGNHTFTAVYTETPVVGPFVNGSFEGEFTGWTWTGSQQSVKIKDGLPATDGLLLIEFNSNSSANDGAISQTFTTTPGTAYNVTFDMGVLAYNTAGQTLQVTATGNGSLLSQSFSLGGNGLGTVRWSSRSVTFTANSATTTLTFRDRSPTGAGLDLLLDNVKVNGSSGGTGGSGGATRSLTVDAVSASSVPMTITPADATGQGNGTTLLTRSYATNTSVQVTAPASAPNGATFVRWVRNGVDLATTRTVNITMDVDTSLVAIYTGGSFAPLGTNLIRNHSFELSPDYAFWSQSGSTRIEKPQASSGFPTDGNHILSFNVGGTPNDGKVSQAFTTVPGTTYTVQMDVGVYGGPGGAAIDQTLNIRTVGVGIPLNRNVTVRGSSTEFVWAPQTFTFVADSTTTTLHLADVSSSGAGTDLFVDNVRIRSGSLAPSVMTVNSTPAPGKAITVGTPDLAGQVNGTTNFTRIYNTGSSVAMVAPHQNFVKWLKNGQWYATNPSINAVVDGNHTFTAVYTETPVVGPFVNGSFESEFTGWTWTGSQQSVKIKDGLPASDGLLLIEFNSNSSANDGAISQTFTTTPGTAYTVTFDMGVLAFNTSRQTLEVAATGNGSLLTQSFSMNGNGSGSVQWTNRTVTFTANSATTTLAFRDRSTTGAGLDLLLDNVRINGSSGANPRTLTVNSTPDAGVPVTVSPADSGGLSNGNTPLTRTFNSGTAVTLTAPATFNGINFQKWQRNGSDLVTTASVTLTLDAATTMTAVYSNAPPPAVIANGSFELGLASWTVGGTANTVDTTTTLPATNGTTVVRFNATNTPNGGTISQTFATNPGTTYTVAFDQGVLSFNTSSQVITATALNATGGTLATQSFTLRGVSNGNTNWAARTLTFTASTTSTTLVFRDASTTGSGLDLLLDNVRISSPSSTESPQPQASAAFDPDLVVDEADQSASTTPAVIGDTPVITGAPGAFRIGLNASEAGRYFLERSSDLRSWNFHSEQTVTEPGYIEFEDNSPPETRMFYRVGRGPADTGN